MTFKIGDQVQVVRHAPPTAGCSYHVGDWGVVKEVEPLTNRLPICVELRRGGEMFFEPCELAPYADEWAERKVREVTAIPAGVEHG